MSSTDIEGDITCNTVVRLSVNPFSVR